MKPDSNNIGIAGGGLLGRLLAWRLLKQGFKVTLFEAGALSASPTASPQAAAFTAAGMVSPLSEAVDSERIIYEMGMHSLQLWPQWLKELQLESGETISYHQRGSLVVAHHQDRNELLQFHTDLSRTLGDTGNYHWLDASKIQQLEPDLNRSFQDGLMLESEAHIDNRHLLRVLLKRIQGLGGDCREHCEVSVEPYTIVSSNGSERFDLVLDCRGVGAKAQRPAVRGVRGEVLGVQTGDVTLSRPVRLMHPRYQLYVVPKAHNCFVIGATQIESEDREPVTLQSSLELSSALYTISPAFAEARIIDLGVNLRPTLPNNHPRIEAEAGLIHCNGLFRHGYLLAPVVVSHALGVILNQEVTDKERMPFAGALGLNEQGSKEERLSEKESSFA